MISGGVMSIPLKLWKCLAGTYDFSDHGIPDGFAELAIKNRIYSQTLIVKELTLI